MLVPASSPQNTNAPDSSAPSALPPRSERTIPLVLGIDPGPRIMGYGAVAVTADGPRLVAAGEFRQPAHRSVPTRLAGLRADLDELLARLDPDIVVVGGDLGRLAVAGKFAERLQALGERRAQPLLVGAALRCRHGVAVGVE